MSADRLANLAVDFVVAHPVLAAVALTVPALALTAARVCRRALDRARARWIESELGERRAVQRG